MLVRSKWQSLPTEAINPSTLAIDKLPPAEIVESMLNEDRKMLAAVQREKERIAVGIEIITQALRHGGRIVFVGAGTSGRLGVVESAEMPPTFGTNPDLVLAVMAGGKDAILRPKEGVEDNYEEGARSINRLRPTKKDVVIGVSASGMTPFVRGGLTRARRAGSCAWASARTVTRPRCGWKTTAPVSTTTRRPEFSTPSTRHARTARASALLW